VEALSSYAKEGRFPRIPSRDLAFRATDLHVRDQTGLIPLSVSSDRIARAAWRCAQLLTESGGGAAPDRAGEDGLVEVYPAAALARWGFSYRGYKHGTPAGRSDRAAARARLVAEIVRRSSSWLALPAETQAACEASDDILDALVASLVTRAAAVGLTERPPQAQQGRAMREGWIHLPLPDCFDRLAAEPG
jgi:Protein of unknown function (DUF429)